ncbi:hypothetical protein Tco_1354026 [Tanacetum coccineum]
MLAPKGPTLNGRPTFANSMYLTKAQSEKPCLYDIPYDQSDPTKRLVLDREETLTLERESRSKLNKDLVRPYDNIKLNSLYEIFKPASQEYHEQLAHANELGKEKASNVFLKEREQYFEIQDLKAQLQDKNIAISKLKKLIEKCKGKFVETKFDKPFVVRQLNDQRIPKPSVLGKPTPFSDSLERKSFSQTKSIPKTNVSEGFIKNQVTTQIFPQTARQAIRNTNVIKPGMCKIDTRTTQTRAPQLPQTSRNTNPRVSTSTRVIHNTNVSIPQLRSTQMKDKVVPNNSQVKDKKTEVEYHPRISSISNKTKSVTACNDSLKSRTSNVNAVCATCGKCVINSNHDTCVSKFLNDVNTRTKKPKVVPISTRKPKSQVKKYVATPPKETIVILFIVDSGCTKHMTGNLTVYYVEGLNHNLFSVGQFYDADLEVAFQKSTCFVRDLQGNDLLTGNRGSDLYTISIQEMTSSTPIYLMAKALPTQADGEKSDKKKEKRDTYILVGYSTQSKGYNVYNKRTRLIVESIHLRFDEIKEMSKASDYDNSGPVPQLQNVSPSADTTAPSQQELDLLFGPLFDFCGYGVGFSSQQVEEEKEERNGVWDKKFRPPTRCPHPFTFFAGREDANREGLPTTRSSNLAREELKTRTKALRNRRRKRGKDDESLFFFLFHQLEREKRNQLERGSRSSARSSGRLVILGNDLSKPVTTHYLPKERESVVVKPHHVIASSESRNSSKNMPRFSSNDMVHNHSLKEAKKKT